ncbi:MAG: hypothetical protein WCK59_01760 [Candidatus Falkowbacteria bacterium]
MNVLLNNQKINFNSNDFPMLISGTEKTGSSFFSVCLLAELLKNGYKVLFLSAYPMAKEEFRKQIGGEFENAVIIESGEESDLIKAIKGLTDLEERLVLIKNIDVYSHKIFDVLKNLQLVIFSGDLDKCKFASSLIDKTFPTKIFFSSSEKDRHVIAPSLAKFCGEVVSKKYGGVISLGI